MGIGCRVVGRRVGLMWNGGSMWSGKCERGECVRKGGGKVGRGKR